MSRRLAAALALLLVGCGLGGADEGILLAAGGAGEGSYTLAARSTPLELVLTRPDGATVVPVDGDDPDLDDAAPFRVVDQGEDVTVVAGAAPRDTARVVVRSGVAEADASLVAVGGTTVFVARMRGHGPIDSITALDAEGVPLDITEPAAGPGTARAGTVADLRGAPRDGARRAAASPAAPPPG